MVRELDERLGLGDLIAQHLTDSRRGKNTPLPLADLLRQSVYSRMAGYEDVNDAERLSQDPTFRLIGSEKIWERGAALTSRLQSFETELLTQEGNPAGLAAINRELIAKAESIDSPQRVVLDMDSTEIPVYGQQENSAYNGHFESTCYHPLLLFNREGDCLGAKLRPGNVHSAEGWEELLLPEIERQQKLGKEVVFRADAAFAKPEVYEALEERGVKYAIRSVSAPVMPVFDSPLDEQVEKLDGLVEDLQAAVAAEGAPGEAGAMPAAGEAAKSSQAEAAPAEAAPGEVAGQAGGQAAGFSDELSQAQATLEAVSTEVPQFVGKYKNLNLVGTGFQMASEMPAQVQGLKESFKALKQVRDLQSANAVATDLRTKVQGLAQMVRGFFRKR